MSAEAGDTIIVGPGSYGDLNLNGTLGDSPGEETPSPGCGCMLSVNKAVTLVSSDGAAATTIDARSVIVHTNVLIIAANVTFGKPGKGFTVTPTRAGAGLATGIAVDGTPVNVLGNQVIDAGVGRDNTAAGIDTVQNDGEMVLIEGNQVVGWTTGIHASSSGKRIFGNHVAFNITGLEAEHASVVAGNVVTNNTGGIQLTDSVSAQGNAVYGNLLDGFLVSSPFSGTITKNNIFANGTFAALNCGIDANTGATVLAPDNYWGAPTGPGGDPADGVCGVGSVTVTSFATKPFNVKAPIKP